MNMRFIYRSLVACASTAVLVLGLGALAPNAFAQGDAQAGATYYKRKCQLCHDLKGIYLRDVASGLTIIMSNPRFPLSKGLKKKSNEKWTEQNLRSFLDNSRRNWPGTSHATAITTNDKDQIIDNLIEFLKTYQ